LGGTDLARVGRSGVQRDVIAADVLAYEADRPGLLRDRVGRDREGVTRR
jgi:hypothetical protein